MRSYIRKAAALGLAGVLVCGTLAGCGKKADTKVDGTKTLMTVNGDTLNLGVGSFLAKYEQAQIYQFYTAYFGMGSEIFDQVTDEESTETYGDTLKDSTIEDLKKQMVIRQHAEEYGVTLTDDEKKAIDDAAQAYIDGNTDEVKEMIGASKEDLVELMTLQTYQAKMMDPIVKDVDTEVSDEEGQVSSLSYITVNVPTEEEVTSGVESAVTAVEPVASVVESAAAAVEAATAGAESVLEEIAAGAESVAEAFASSGAESVAEEVVETSLQLSAKAKAQSVINAILAADNIADADLSEIAKTVDDSLTSVRGQFTTYDPEDTTLDASIVDAVKDLEDGTLVETPIRSEDGTKYYVVRFDKTYDEERTKTKKDSVVTERKQTLFDETTDKWVEEAEITVDEDAWKSVTLTDKAPVTLAVAPAPETTADEAAVSGAESIPTLVEVESIAEPATSAAEEVLSIVEDVTAETLSQAEDAAN